MTISTYRKYPRAPRTRRTAPQNQWKFLYLAVLVFLFLFVTIGPYGFWRLHKMKIYKEELFNKTKEATMLNTELRNKLVAIKTDKAFQEKLVRARLGWIRDGEIIYKFLNSSKKR